MMQTNCRILVLSGGPSSEREVSLRSGLAVAVACRALGHQVLEADINPEDLSALDQEFDLVFPVLHGSFGEDGQLQSILESRGLRFVGSDSRSSGLAFDKAEAKKIWLVNGLPTPRYLVFDAMPNVADLNTFEHVCCKPTREGSSVGVAFAQSSVDAVRVVEQLLPLHGQVLVEDYILGRELTVGILDGTPLPIVEIRPGSDFYDYEAKYTRSDTQYVVPAEIGVDDTRDLQALAMAAFDQLGCAHYGRVDLILHPTRGPFVLEVNTIPGFTATSLLPKAAAANKLSFSDVVQKLIELGVRQ